jgi:acetylornithine/succinyldiaminopimelate/putrescine aminotransferase
MDQVVVMQNLFHGRTIGHVFDLKGSSRSRYVTVVPPTVTASTVSGTPGGEGAVTAAADTVSVLV